MYHRPKKKTIKIKPVIFLQECNNDIHVISPPGVQRLRKGPVSCMAQAHTPATDHAFLGSIHSDSHCGLRHTSLLQTNPSIWAKLNTHGSHVCAFSACSQQSIMPHTHKKICKEQMLMSYLCEWLYSEDSTTNFIIMVHIVRMDSCTTMDGWSNHDWLDHVQMDSFICMTSIKLVFILLVHCDHIHLWIIQQIWSGYSKQTDERIVLTNWIMMFISGSCLKIMNIYKNTWKT